MYDERTLESFGGAQDAGSFETRRDMQGARSFDTRRGMRSRIALAAGIAAVCALLAMGTYAFTAVKGTAENEVVAGTVDIELSQVNGQGLSGFSPDALALSPDAPLSQTLTVRNAGDHPVYLRMQLIPVVEGADGADAGSAQGALALSGTDAAWVEQGGFWYYSAALQPGQSTEPLFTQVALAEGYAPEADRVVRLEVKALSVQSDNNGTDPRTAAGWPEL